MVLNVTLFALVVFACLMTAEGFGRGRLREKRQLGGLTQVDINDAVIIEKANFAVEELGSEYSLLNLTEAYTQVVSGILYHLDITVSKTSSSGTDLYTYTCNVKVYEKVWLDYIVLSEFYCELE